MSSISVIIPTYNEEEYLPHLLQSLAKQSLEPLEVIVADANSQDSTREIALKADCMVVDGGLPAVGRNRGAQVAQGDYLLFLDADVIVPSDFIEKALKEFEDRYLEIAPIKFKPISSLKLDKLMFRINELAQQGLQEFYPISPGAALIVTKRLHRRIGGFDEESEIEDNDYGDRARAIAKFGVITTTYVNLSVRRFDKEGRFKLLNKYMKRGFFRRLRSLGVDYDFKYQFGDYSEAEGLTRAERFLENILQQLENKKDSF
ncbi:glycosyltransferase [Candidatus Berkelbacteria bacterium]|nr:glycosyltransferase [Candidatus Berkelbacteria bacterium]